MLIDHIAVFFIPKSMPLYFVCRVVGRLTCPIMCFFIVEGFVHTSSKKKYFIRLLIFAILSQFAYIYARYGIIFTLKFILDYNVIFTFLISLLVLICYENINKDILKWSLIVFLILISYFCDWGIFAPVTVLMFHIFKNNKSKQTLFYIIICLLDILAVIVYWILKGRVWYNEIWQVGIFLFIPFIYLYNGESGKKSYFNKWFFYVFYPLHLIILGLFKYLL